MTISLDLIRSLSEARVLVVGDLMLDCFVSGSIGRISPEAPIPVFRRDREDFCLGGAGNVMRNLRSLDCSASLVACCGEDPEGHRLKDLVGELAPVRSVLVIEAGRPTTVKTRFVADRQQVLRVDSEECRPISAATASKVVEAVTAMLPDCDALILSDYGKGLLTENVVSTVIEEAGRNDCILLVDPKGRDYSRYRSASIVTPNLRELAEATGLEIGTDAEVEQAGAQVIEECGIGAVLATRGAVGLSLIQPDEPPAHLRAVAREVWDVSGAGDTVIAVVAAAVAAGAELIEACALANLAAGVVVGKAGTATVRSHELVRSAHKNTLSQAEAKIVDAETLLEIVERWRRQGHRIGFANGVFDLLHPGHVNLLRQATQHCTRLIVGLNGDDSVRRITGRLPIQTEVSRSSIVASLEAVDAVVVYPEDTPVELLMRVRPDVLIKGANYAPHEVVGADLVRSYGGEVFLARIDETTALDSRLTSITNDPL